MSYVGAKHTRGSTKTTKNLRDFGDALNALVLNIGFFAKNYFLLAEQFRNGSTTLQFSKEKNLLVWVRELFI